MRVGTCDRCGEKNVPRNIRTAGVLLVWWQLPPRKNKGLRQKKPPPRHDYQQERLERADLCSTCHEELALPEASRPEWPWCWAWAANVHVADSLSKSLERADVQQHSRDRSPEPGDRGAAGEPGGAGQGPA